MYPLAILKQETKIHPLLGDALRGDPHVFDFSAANPSASEYETTDYDAFQSAILEELERSGKQWGVGRYLEERRTLLRNYPQMIEEGRVYHAGLDITSPAGTPIPEKESRPVRIPTWLTMLALTSATSTCAGSYQGSCSSMSRAFGLERTPWGKASAITRFTSG